MKDVREIYSKQVTEITFRDISLCGMKIFLNGLRSA